MKNFNFVISADNNPALKSLRAISAELYRVNNAFRRTKTGGTTAGIDPKALNSVSQELKAVNSIFKTMTASKNQWERDAGFGQLKNAFKGTAEAAGELKTQVSGILAPVLALTGIGTVAGIAGIASHIGNLANQTKLLNYETDISQKTIQSWMGVGESFGIKAEDMASGLAGFSKNMEDAAFGRNNGLLAFLSRPDINVQDIRTRVQSPEGIDGLLKEVSTKLQKFPAVARSQMLDFVGLGFEKPMLAYGPEEIEKRKGITDRFGYIRSDEETKQAQDYARAMFQLDVSLTTFEKIISNQIMPVLQPMAEGFSEWITKTENVKTVFDILAVTIGVTLVGAVTRLSIAIAASPIGRIIALVEAIVAGGTYAYEHWKPFHDMLWETLTFWDRLHFSNFGSSKSMVESFPEWQKRMSGMGTFQPPAVTTPTSLSGAGLTPMPVGSTNGIPNPPTPDQIAAQGMDVGAFGKDSTIINASSLQEHRITVDMNNVPPGTKVSTKSNTKQQIPVNINYSLQSIP